MHRDPSSMKVRRPAVASSFYPASAVELACTIELLFDSARRAPCPRTPKAIVAPHAGYGYSGPVAASAYASILPARGLVTRAVLLGPAHYVPFEGLATSDAVSFTTPIGELVCDRDAALALAGLPHVAAVDVVHESEHSIEVQLPFLQAALGEQVQIVPILVGSIGDEHVGRLLDALWDGDETLVVVSSDLSQHLDYESGKARDAATTRSIEALDADAIRDEDVCGSSSLRALIRAAKRREMTISTLDVRSSGDTAGARNEVVGYGAWAVW